MVALSGDYDFQFMIEELAVGAQFNLPYVHVAGEQLLPGADPAVAARLRHGLLRAAALRQHQLARSSSGYGVDHVKVAEGLGCKAIRVRPARRPAAGAASRRKKLMAEYRVPVVVEVILERVTNISMGTEIDNVVEFEELADARRARPDRHRAAGLEPLDAEAGRLMHVVVAPDKFKGSLTAARGGRAGGAPGSPTRSPDVRGACGAGGRRRRRHRRRRPGRGLRAGPGARGRGPLGDPVDTAFAVRDGVAVVEMAAASGLRLLPTDGRRRRWRRQLVRHRRADRAPPWTRGCHTVVARHRRQRQHRRRRRHARGARRPAARRRRGRAAPRRRRAGRLDRRRPGRAAPAAGATRGDRGQRRGQPAARPARRRRGLRAAEGRDPDDVAAARRRRSPAGPTSLAAAMRPERPRLVAARAAGSRRRRRRRLRRAGRAGRRAAARDRPDARPGRVRTHCPAPTGDHRRGLAGRADPARQGPGRGRRGRRRGRRPGGGRLRPAALSPDQLRAAGFAAAYALTDIEPDPRRCMAEAGPAAGAAGRAARPGLAHRIRS